MKLYLPMWLILVTNNFQQLFFVSCAKVSAARVQVFYMTRLKFFQLNLGYDS